MSRTRQLPRPEQVELLTRGVRLPLDALDEEHLLVIIEHLARTWDGLIRAHRVLDSLTESEITTMMESSLNNAESEDPRWEALVTNVVRGHETFNYDASRLELRPDLSIALTHPDRRPFPVIVECKRIDKSAGMTINLYGSKGLLRFVNGDYAWYAREGIMLAYVGDSSTIQGCLTPHLERQQAKDSDVYLTEQLPLLDERIPRGLARSRHGRTFCYPSTRNEPGPIVIWHLWLVRSQILVRGNLPSPIEM